MSVLTGLLTETAEVFHRATLSHLSGVSVTTSTAYRQRGYPKHRGPRCERFALFNRRVAGQLQMRATAWGDFGIAADDRWAVLDSDLFEPDGFLTATTQDRRATSGVMFSTQFRVVTQHGHQVLGTVTIRDDYLGAQSADRFACR